VNEIAGVGKLWSPYILGEGEYVEFHPPGGGGYSFQVVVKDGVLQVRCGEVMSILPLSPNLLTINMVADPERMR